MYFLTEGGRFVMEDVRCNSYDAALNLCLENGFKGIVSDASPLLKDTKRIIDMFHEKRLQVFSYGGENVDEESIKTQNVNGIDGIITDECQLVRHILIK